MVRSDWIINYTKNDHGRKNITHNVKTFIHFVRSTIVLGTHDSE